MTMRNTRLEVADNSGARVVSCIGLYGGAKSFKVGDVIKVAVKVAIPRGKVSKGKVYGAVVVRTRVGDRFSDGGYVRFSSNAVVLLNDQGEPIGTRVFGPIRKLPVSLPVRMRIMSLAVEVIG